jgi:protoheme IX farnesyltransferase
MNRGLNRFAILVACATFFLIIAGALVTSHDAGLATPDWPLSNGQFFPKMVGNLFWEHGHRMVATTVGMLTIVLLIYILAKEKRSWVRKLGVFALLAVIAQGLLGGLTVKMMLPLAVSSAHATLAQLFFCTTVSLAVFTSKSWIEARRLEEEQGRVPLRHLCTAALVTIFIQLIIGATLRHSATWDQHLPVELVLTHILGAVGVTMTLGSAALTVLRRHKGEKFLTRPATIALSLLLVQLFLGVAAYLTRLKSPGDPQPLNPMVGITVAHVACGALVFVSTIVLTLRTYRVLGGDFVGAALRRRPNRDFVRLGGGHGDLRGSAVAVVERARLTFRERAAAYVELTKPRITFLIVLTAAAGFALASIGHIDYLAMLRALIGIGLLSSGIATLNQYAERELDGLMRRTANRPLPSGKLAPWEALAFGAGITILAEAYLLVLVNPLSALLGLTVIAGYLFAYTPLKTRTTLSTLVGAFPGAVPPLIGWTAARGTISLEGWILFAILFLWQFPHFLAIAWMYREDYSRAGILMLPVVEPDGRVTAQQIVAYTLMLLPVSLLPTLMGMSGKIYFVGAIVLGLLFLYSSLRAAFSMSRQHARRLLLASVLYLPLLFILMVLNT